METQTIQVPRSLFRAVFLAYRESNRTDTGTHYAPK
jgi:hypothetical protein